MRVLTPEEVREWLNSQRPAEPCSSGAGERHSVDFSVPGLSRDQAHLARFLIGILGDFERLLVSIEGWSIWPSEENMVLVDKFREAYGEMRPLIEAPGHEFSHGEVEECVGLLRLCIAFGWDVKVFAANSADHICITHHGEGLLILSASSDVAEARSFLSQEDSTNPNVSGNLRPGGLHNCTPPHHGARQCSGSVPPP